MKNTWFDGERPTDSGGTVYVKPEQPDVLELVGDVVKSWRHYTATSTIGDLHRSLNRLEKVWPS